MGTVLCKTNLEEIVNLPVTTVRGEMAGQKINRKIKIVVEKK